MQLINLTFLGLLLALFFLLSRLLLSFLPLLLLLLQPLHLFLHILLILFQFSVINLLGQDESPRLDFRVHLFLRPHLLAQTSRHYPLTRG